MRGAGVDARYLGLPGDAPAARPSGLDNPRRAVRGAGVAVRAAVADRGRGGSMAAAAVATAARRQLQLGRPVRNPGRYRRGRQDRLAAPRDVRRAGGVAGVGGPRCGPDARPRPATPRPAAATLRPRHRAAGVAGRSARDRVRGPPYPPGRPAPGRDLVETGRTRDLVDAGPVGPGLTRQRPV